MEKLQGVKINGYTNKWSAIDELVVCDKTTNMNKHYYLMENDTFGDETCYLVVDINLNVVGETFDDIETALQDLDIL